MRKNVLCIDENRAIRFLFESLLNPKYSVCVVQNSYYAMQKLFSGKQYDLIIIGIDSTQDENFELLQHIFSSSFLKNIPIIVLSNNNDTQFRSMCSETEIIAFMVKPFDPIIFLNKIDAFLINPNKSQILRKKRKIFNLNFYL